MVTWDESKRLESKPDATFRKFSPEQIEAAIAAAPDVVDDPETRDIDWADAVVTPGGGVKATLTALRRARGPNKRPTKEQVAIRFSPEVLAYFRATGRGWQTRMDEALREYIASHPM
ncbi:MAG TPA: BrnA antitoxin family protein [Xanthomonadaceae bacterium]|nr:BrnA antitoxin family protein [Xanthomonadaceae bacterium]